MKVEVNLTLVKKPETAGKDSPRNSRISRAASSPGIELLISQENQQARRLDPSSVPEARTLLVAINRKLAATPAETLSGMHLLDSSCLIRLP